LKLKSIFFILLLVGSLFWGLINSAGFISLYFIEDIQNAFEINLFPDNLAEYLNSYLFLKIIFAWLPFTFIFFLYYFQKKN
tara:strand:+ start:375 stop:617 length:243 start_codon:yes stop_codon:yes gene_type:complete